MDKANKCSGCRSTAPCSLPADAAGLRTAINTHGQAHPGNDSCAFCNVKNDELEALYRRIAECYFRS